MRSIHLEFTHDEPLLDQAQARIGEEEFISTAKAFLCLLARAEFEYLEYVQPKLLPHRLSFDRGSNSTQGAQSERPSHWAMVDIQPAANFPPTGSSQVETNRNEPLEVSVAHDSDDQAGTSMCVSNPSFFPSYISSASISPSPPASTPGPLPEHVPIWQEGSPQSLYARRMQRLDCLHPEIQKYIASIIWLGDNFLLEGVGKFLRLFCRRWSQTDLGYHPFPDSFAGDDSRMQSLFRRYYHAETFRRRSGIDRLKFRFLRILLYHDFEELCIDIQNNLERYRPLSRGQDATTVATDRFIDGLSKAYGEGVLTRTEDQRRESFRKHKAIGRRWSIVASHFGLGIFLTCSPELEAKINDHNFPERRFPALLTYILNVYPRGSQLNRELDPFLRSIIQGVSPPLWPTKASLNMLSSYKQENESSDTNLHKEWLRVEVHNEFYRIL